MYSYTYTQYNAQMPPKSTCMHYPLLNLKKSSISLILIILIAKSPPWLAIPLPLSVIFGLNTVHISLSHLVAIHWNFPKLTFTMLSILSTLGRQIMPPKLPTHSSPSPINPSTPVNPPPPMQVWCLGRFMQWRLQTWARHWTRQGWCPCHILWWVKWGWGQQKRWVEERWRITCKVLLIP